MRDPERDERLLQELMRHPRRGGRLWLLVAIVLLLVFAASAFQGY